LLAMLQVHNARGSLVEGSGLDLDVPQVDVK